MENQNVIPLIGMESLRDYVLLERKTKNIVLGLLSQEKDVDLKALSEIEHYLMLLVKNINNFQKEAAALEDLPTDHPEDPSKYAVDDRRLKIITSIRSMVALLKQSQETKETPGSSEQKPTQWVPRLI